MYSAAVFHCTAVDCWSNTPQVPGNRPDVERHCRVIAWTPLPASRTARTCLRWECIRPRRNRRSFASHFQCLVQSPAKQKRTGLKKKARSKLTSSVGHREGHAGLFSAADDVVTLGRALLFNRPVSLVCIHSYVFVHPFSFAKV